jgi:hypothetical protein
VNDSGRHFFGGSSGKVEFEVVPSDFAGLERKGVLKVLFQLKGGIDEFKERGCIGWQYKWKLIGAQMTTQFTRELRLK